MPTHRWWDGQPTERYWLEATDRDDIGANLRAPLADDSGKPSWRYTLFQDAKLGDIVLHYDKRKATGGVVAFSTIAGNWFERNIVWGARGASARERGLGERERPGYVVPLKQTRLLSAPISLDAIRQQQPALTALRDRLTAAFGKPLYFPFELSDKRPARLLQGYAFKLPAGFLGLFPSETAAVHGTPHVPLPERLSVTTLADLMDYSDIAVQEGRRTYNHATKERSREVVRKRKALALRTSGKLVCEACGFDFVERYGARGEGFIECHHTVPLSELKEGEETRLVDLALLCSNCHRMIHAKTPWLTVEELRALLR